MTATSDALAKARSALAVSDKVTYPSFVAARHVREVMRGLVDALTHSAPVAEMTEEQIKHMVNRFLGWRLPEDFHPDDGISFKPTFNDHMPTPTRHKPVGTNLFDAAQATAMVRCMIEGMPGTHTK